MVRAGVIVENLRYTFRLILLHCGEQRFRELLAGFWREHTPQPFADREVEAFAGYASAHLPEVPHLL